MSNFCHCHGSLYSVGTDHIVKIHGGYKWFHRKQDPILSDFSMKVKCGTVYALLGSSGSGKTTVLNSLVGFNELDKGQIFIAGNMISNSTPKIGYMPQEISLYCEFSILETLVYFGKLFGVNSSELPSKIEFLINLFHLPNRSKSVGKLSGGQRKRVSLAVALIRDPEILLLDEPTSGIDSLMRMKIWKHLKFLAKDKGVTVILTTHYTDEAKNADAIGIMRDGRLIVEENPTTLLSLHGTLSLDDVILDLWKQKQNILCKPPSENYSESHQTACTCQYSSKKEEVKTCLQSSVRRIKALIWKNWMLMCRNQALFCFIMIMPSLITLITCTTFRHEPQNLPLGIVNQETLSEQCFESHGQTGCLEGLLSCKFLEELQSSKNIHGILFETVETAKQSVRDGNSFGVLIFPRNFSSALVTRRLHGHLADLDVWNMSTITVQLDQTSKENLMAAFKNSLIRATLLATLYKTMEQFSRRISKECGYDPREGEFVLQYKNPPLVGNANHGFMDYVTPGFSFAWLFFFPLISTSIRLIGEKRQGTLARTLTNEGGRVIQLLEVLVAYIVTETIIIVVQATLTYSILRFVCYVGCPMTFSESILLPLAMFIFGGFSGLCCGFLLGLLCSQEIQAAMISIAIFFPNSFICGLVWPVEGMPMVLQYISPFLPFTLPSEALRSLMSRGWEFSHPNVWPGFIVVNLYTLIYIMSIVFLLVFKKKI